VLRYQLLSRHFLFYSKRHIDIKWCEERGSANNAAKLASVLDLCVFNLPVKVLGSQCLEFEPNWCGLVILLDIRKFRCEPRVALAYAVERCL